MRVLGNFQLCRQCAEARDVDEVGTPYEGGKSLCALCRSGEELLTIPIVAISYGFPIDRGWDKPAWYLDPRINKAIRGEKEKGGK